ncbi:MAG: hypothetical protein CL927_01270 [Deltaproteobacteria bacterium]|nr:hypothetical protein [Deltaproteobacteria bacterium]HCH64727.1 hypothetical protein [Deltaproteobacteria bacterium]
MNEGDPTGVSYDDFVARSVGQKTQREVISSIALAGTLISLGYAIAFFALSFRVVGLETFLFASVYGAVVVLSRRPGVPIRPLGVAFMVAALVHTASLGLLFLPASSGMHLWALIIPFFSVISIDRRDLLWSVVCSGLASGVVVFMEWSDGVHVPVMQVAVEEAVLPWLRAVTILGIVLFVTAISWISHRKLEGAHEALQRSYSQSESLLLNILPASVAERLKAHSGVIADDIPQASVLFCDLVGFTALASQQSASQTVEMLNSVFVAFDEAIAARGLEKIKAIGDAYMVASGVPTQRSDHATSMVHLARDFFDILDRFNAERGLALSLRVGISCGSVTAGIIGKHKFAYDIWGDTVNVASRMESTGVAGRIQVTRAFVEATEGAFVFEPRQGVVIKGKGEMTTYLLVGSA